MKLGGVVCVLCYMFDMVVLIRWLFLYLCYVCCVLVFCVGLCCLVVSLFGCQLSVVNFGILNDSMVVVMNMLIIVIFLRCRMLWNVCVFLVDVVWCRCGSVEKWLSLLSISVSVMSSSFSSNMCFYVLLLSGVSELLSLWIVLSMFVLSMKIIVMIDVCDRCWLMWISVLCVIDDLSVGSIVSLFVSMRLFQMVVVSRCSVCMLIVVDSMLLLVVCLSDVLLVVIMIIVSYSIVCVSGLFGFVSVMIVSIIVLVNVMFYVKFVCVCISMMGIVVNVLLSFVLFIVVVLQMSQLRLVSISVSVVVISECCVCSYVGCDGVMIGCVLFLLSYVLSSVELIVIVNVVFISVVSVIWLIYKLLNFIVCIFL